MCIEIPMHFLEAILTSLIGSEPKLLYTYHPIFPGVLNTFLLYLAGNIVW
jgi:hypothetical protein